MRYLILLTGLISIYTIIIPPSSIKKSQSDIQSIDQQTIRDNYSEDNLNKFQKRVNKLSLKYPETIFSESPYFRKELALTFDDGPNPKYTLKILKILKDEQVKATFFMLGFKVKNHPEIVKQVFEEGHEIANHSYTHTNFLTLSKERVLNIEIIKTEKLLQEITGSKHTLIRPPYGVIKHSQINLLKEHQKKIIFWSIDSLDWYPPEKESKKIVKRVSRLIYPGAIIMMHDAGFYSTTKALPEIIKKARDKYYKFVTVSELLQKRSFY